MRLSAGKLIGRAVDLVRWHEVEYCTSLMSPMSGCETLSCYLMLTSLRNGCAASATRTFTQFFVPLVRVTLLSSFDRLQNTFFYHFGEIPFENVLEMLM